MRTPWLLALAAVLAGCSDDGGSERAGSTSATPATTAPASATWHTVAGRAGEPAPSPRPVQRAPWDPPDDVDPAARTFDLEVWRLAPCDPREAVHEVVIDDAFRDKVVIEVRLVQPRRAPDCGDDTGFFTVTIRLPDPVGDRALVDPACLDYDVPERLRTAADCAPLPSTSTSEPFVSPAN